MSRSSAGGEIVLASSNPGKLREFQELLADLPIRLRSLAEFPGVAMPDEGVDYAANAELKASSVAEATGLPALADDSGLEVDALDGAPGPLSARYGGPELDDAGRVTHLLEAIRGSQARGARFVCEAAVAVPGGAVTRERGECPGRIREAPSGGGGFGYDPVFEPGEPGAWRGCSMAELPAEEKNRISHRARALNALAPAILAAVGAAESSRP